MEYNPEDVFDPFSEYVPDFSEYCYDPSSQTIYDGEGQPYETQVTTVCNTMYQCDQDPNSSLKQLLSQDYESHRPEVTDPTDTMPKDNPIYNRINEEAIFFHDVAFAAPVLRSEQQCKTAELKGYIIVPASSATAIRSRASNHNKTVSALYIKDIGEMRQFFE